MLGTFLTMITSIFPFLKELILGNQTVRDALSHNKLMVLMSFLFLFMIGANLYMDDADHYLKGQVDDLTKQLALAKSPQPSPICPKSIAPIVLAPPAASVITPPAVTGSAPTQADIEAKDATIHKLEEQLRARKRSEPSKTVAPATTSNTHDPLDRLYN